MISPTVATLHLPMMNAGMIDSVTGMTVPWTFMDPLIGNCWRAKVKGHRALAFALWMYCDDTSGNLLKKWNEHNSFLVMSAALPHREAQKEYNIHFLAMLNTALPLEMLDGIVERLEYVNNTISPWLALMCGCRTAQDEGIWAWDCEMGEAVLVIPFVLALLGDNPMQSEFACHIGL